MRLPALLPVLPTLCGAMLLLLPAGPAAACDRDPDGSTTEAPPRPAGAPGAAGAPDRPAARDGAGAGAAARGPAGGGDPDHGRPVALIARDLGVTPEQFRAAFAKVHPAPRGQRPTEAQRAENRQVLASALGVAPERLDEVMDRYRPEGRQPR